MAAALVREILILWRWLREAGGAREDLRRRLEIDDLIQTFGVLSYLPL
jgi:hypothetical protein